LILPLLNKLTPSELAAATGLSPGYCGAIRVGSAVCFAGTTVVIALLGLTVVGIPFLTAMGLAAAATVIIAVLIAITLLPAFMGFAGTRLGPRRHRLPKTTLGHRWVMNVTRHPVAFLIVVIAVFAACAFSARAWARACPMTAHSRRARPSIAPMSCCRRGSARVSMGRF
jgi:lysylphosphatidylglycerol synthetase-like protein (DUF2156 family)